MIDLKNPADAAVELPGGLFLSCDGIAGPWGVVVSSHIYVCNTMSRWTPDTDTILTLQTRVIY